VKGVKTSVILMFVKCKYKTYRNSSHHRIPERPTSLFTLNIH